MIDKSRMSEEVARLLDASEALKIEIELGVRMFQKDAARIAKLFDEEQEAAKAARPPKGNAPRPIGDDDKLRIDEIVCLPELGGYLAIDAAFNRASAKFTEKVIRGYIKKGLPVVRQGKIINIKPKSLREFLSECEDQPSPLTSSGSNLPTTKPRASSKQTGTGRSSTDRSSLAQASALSFVQKLRKSG